MFKEELTRIEGKLDSLDTKFDEYSLEQRERMTATEIDVRWLKAHLKLSLSVAIAVIGSLALAYFKHIKLIP